MSQYLPFLFFLACPISMGVMMWMMMRQDHGQASNLDPRIAVLESQVNDLRMTLRLTELSDARGPMTATLSTLKD